MGRTLLSVAVIILLSLTQATVSAQADDTVVFRVLPIEDVEPDSMVQLAIDCPTGSGPLAGFEFELFFDFPGITLQGATEGPALIRCKWEYFEFRYITLMPELNESSLAVKFVAYSETNNGPFHPVCSSFEPGDTLFFVTVHIPDDSMLDCSNIPVRFYWSECVSNAIADSGSYEYHFVSELYDPYLIEEPFPDTLPNFRGTPEYCFEEFEYPYSRGLELHNGWIEMKCNTRPPQPGDLNLNDTPFEIADAVLFSNYFVKGPIVFFKDLDRQITASDCNQDGLYLTVADFTYLIRVVIGDATPYETPAHNRDRLQLPDIGQEPATD